MAQLKVIETRVKELLEENQEARDNDQLLYVLYLETYHFIEFNKNVFAHYEEYHIPPFSSVERAARDIKRKQKYITMTEKEIKKRKSAEEKYKEFYGGNRNA